MQKDQKKADKLFDKIKKEISTFKFTSLFIEKVTARIEEISSNIIKYEKDMFLLCSKETKLNKKEFMKLFKNNETSMTVLDQIKKDYLNSSVDKELFTKEFTKINKKLSLIETNQKLSIQDIKLINKDRRVGEIKERLSLIHI